MADQYSYIDPAEDDNWTAWQAYRQRQQAFSSQTQGSGLAEKAAALTAYYPNLQPGVVLALARANIAPGSDLAEQSNSATQKVQQQKAPKKSWYHSLFNATIRGGMTALSYPAQEISGVVRTEAKNIQDNGVLGSFAAPFRADSGISVNAVNAQTDLGQIAQTAGAGQRVDTGSGFFVSPESEIGKAQSQAARDNWMVDGHAATLGRVVAGRVFEPDSKAYNILSGSLDLANATLGDPTNVFGGELTKLRQAKKLFQPGEVGVLPKIALSPEIAGRQLTAGGIVNKAAIGHKIYDTSELKAGQTISEAGRILDKKGVDIGPAKLTDSPEVTGAIGGDYKAVASTIANQWLESRAGRILSGRLAEMDSPTDIRNAMKKKIDIDIAKELADAPTPEAVQDIIRREAVDGRIREKPYTNGFASWKPTQQLGYQLSRKMESVRLFQAMPGDKFLLSDPTQAVDQLDRTLKNAAMDPSETRKWTDQLARATSNEDRRTIIFNAMGAIGTKLQGLDRDFSKWSPEQIKALADENVALLSKGDLVRDVNGAEYGKVTSLNKKLGTVGVQYNDGSKVSLPAHSILTHDDELTGNAVNSLVQLYRKTNKGFSSYNIDDAGKEVGVEGLTINKNGVAIPQPLLFSQLQNEMLPGLSRDQLISIRRETAAFRRVLTSDPYQGGAKVARKVQSTWRDFQLLRGAYTLRVVGEEQLRMAANNLDSILSFHPISAIAWAVGDHNPKFGDWVPFVGGKEVPISDWLQSRVATRGERGATDAWGKNWNDAAEEEGVNSDFLNSHMKLHADKRWAMNTKFNGWIPVSKGHEQYANGWSTELGQLHADPVASRLAGGWKQGDDAALSGNDVADVKEWFWNGNGRQSRIEMSKRGGNWSKLADDKEMSDNYIDAIDGMLQHKTANDPELRALVAYGTVAKDGDITPATRKSVTDLLQRKADSGKGPEMVRAHTTDVTPEHRNNAIDHAFDILISKPSNYLSRSPAFRQYYWQRMGELMPTLNKADQATVLENARDANLGDRWLQPLINGFKKGSGDNDLNSIDLLAKTHALDTTKALLYDLGERSQFFDQLKIVFPFGEAWKEALQTYAKAFSRSPHQMYRLGQTVDGAEGSGFFYTDENGQTVFNYPLSAQVSQWMTGTFTPFKGQVSGLNLAGNGLPGVGPVMQMSLGKLVSDKPNIPDWVNQWILPTGDPDYSGGFLEAWFPGWSKRVYTALVQADPDNRQFGNTMGAIAAYKMTTGKYNMNTQEGMAELERDSKKSARLMYVLRGLSQFIAPTAPSPEWMAKDQDGTMTTASKLMQDYRDMQNDPNIGYDNATQAFLDKYGENALLYMQSKSEGGFSPTTDLHKWVQDHPELTTKYRNVYGYFAGDGGQYSNNEYERQLASGEREKLTPRQIMELANDRVARLQYQQARTLVGPKPTENGKEFLRNLQQALTEKYPGYKPDGYSTKDRAASIRDIQKAVSDEPVLAKSDIGQDAIKYLHKRDLVLSQIPNFQQTKAGATARAALRAYGEALVSSNPDFQRMWDLFDGEMKDDSTGDN